MREAFVNSLVDLASKDKNIVLLTADLGFGVFERFEQLYPDQFYRNRTWAGRSAAGESCECGKAGTGEGETGPNSPVQRVQDQAFEP